MQLYGTDGKLTADGIRSVIEQGGSVLLHQPTTFEDGSIGIIPALPVWEQKDLPTAADLAAGTDRAETVAADLDAQIARLQAERAKLSPVEAQAVTPVEEAPRAVNKAGAEALAKFNADKQKAKELGYTGPFNKEGVAAFFAARETQQTPPSA